LPICALRIRSPNQTEPAQRVALISSTETCSPSHFPC
jgi:hypothetical protein